MLCRERTGRTPRELALEIRDGVSQGQDMLKIPRGDIEATIQRLADAEIKEKESNATREKAQKLFEKRSKTEKLGDAAAVGDLEESPLSKDNRSTSALPKKVLCPKTLGSALSGSNFEILLSSCLCLLYSNISSNFCLCVQLESSCACRFLFIDYGVLNNLLQKKM